MTTTTTDQQQQLELFNQNFSRDYKFTSVEPEKPAYKSVGPKTSRVALIEPKSSLNHAANAQVQGFRDIDDEADRELLYHLNKNMQTSQDFFRRPRKGENRHNALAYGEDNGAQNIWVQNAHISAPAPSKPPRKRSQRQKAKGSGNKFACGIEAQTDYEMMVRNKFDIVFEPGLPMMMASNPISPDASRSALNMRRNRISSAKMSQRSGAQSEKSPSKMSSPERKLYQKKLFAMDEQITQKVKETINYVKKVRTEIKGTIDQNNKIVKSYDTQIDNFNKAMQKITAPKDNFTNVKNVVIEPNLSRRMEQKALRKAQTLREQELVEQMIECPSQPQNLKKGGLSYVPEVEVEGESSPDKKNNLRESSEKEKRTKSFTLKPPPCLTQHSFIQHKMKEVITSSSTKASSMALIKRQFTAQFMPMHRHRVRQRSAGFKSMKSSRKQLESEQSLEPKYVTQCPHHGGSSAQHSSSNLHRTSSTQRITEAAPQSDTKPALPTIHRMATRKRSKHNSSSHQKPPRKEKMPFKSASKENQEDTSGFRVRKVFINGQIQHLRGNGSSKDLMHLDASPANLQTTSNVNRSFQKRQSQTHSGHHSALSRRNERQRSIHSPRILKGILQN